MDDEPLGKVHNKRDSANVLLHDSGKGHCNHHSPVSHFSLTVSLSTAPARIPRNVQHLQLNISAKHGWLVNAHQSVVQNTSTCRKTGHHNMSITWPNACHAPVMPMDFCSRLESRHSWTAHGRDHTRMKRLLRFWMGGENVNHKQL